MFASALGEEQDLSPTSVTAPRSDLVKMLYKSWTESNGQTITLMETWSVSSVHLLQGRKQDLRS